jgi:hypothetical protein
MRKLTRLVRFRLAVLTLVLALPAAVKAQYTYTTNNGTITITGYTGPAGAVTIPGTIDGLPVTGIGDEAFAFLWNLTSVVIPDSVTNLGVFAFGTCPNLTAITVGANNPAFTSVAGVLFDRSQTTLIQYPEAKVETSYTIPNGVTNIAAEAFDGCAKLTTVTIPDSVMGIGNYAFSGCASLASVTIGNGVTSIGDYGFDYCSSLTNVTMGNSVSSIGDHAFAVCNDLTTITIPGSVTNIGAYAFYGCGPLLRSLYFQGNAPSLGSYAFDYDHNATVYYLRETAGWGSTYGGLPTVLPNSGSVGGFNWEIVNGAVTVTGYTGSGGVVIIPSLTNGLPVTAIAGYAFYRGEELAKVTIPDGVTSIGDYAFAACKSLTNVTIPNSVTIIGDHAFDSCLSLTNVTIPNSVIAIGEYAFSSCAFLTSITIGSGVTGIEDYTFDNCFGLTNITIPSSVNSLGVGAFYECLGLTGIYFQGDAPNLSGESVFDALPDTTTVYYLPGTTGWRTTFGGRPTALWKPEVQTGHSSFGVRTNQFGFNIAWAGGMTVVVEASTSLVNPTWSPISTNTFSGNTLYFSDAQWTNYPSRFYRVMWP